MFKLVRTPFFGFLASRRCFLISYLYGLEIYTRVSITAKVSVTKRRNWLIVCLIYVRKIISEWRACRTWFKIVRILTHFSNLYNSKGMTLFNFFYSILHLVCDEQPSCEIWRKTKDINVKALKNCKVNHLCFFMV